jgi:hypothetical protein
VRNLVSNLSVNQDDGPPQKATASHPVNYSALHHDTKEFLFEALQSMAKDATHSATLCTTLAALQQLPFAAYLPPDHALRTDLADPEILVVRLGCACGLVCESV